MRREVILMGLLMAGCYSISAQGLGDIFGSGSSEVAENLRQIALLQGLINVTDMGYSITEEGLMNISTISGEELGAHSDYLSRLSKVNPAVAGMTEVGDILTLDKLMLEEMAEGLGRWKSSGKIVSWELDLAQGVYSVVAGQVDGEVTELRNYLTDGSLVMMDGERIKRVVAMMGPVRRRMGWVKLFCEGMDRLVLERKRS